MEADIVRDQLILARSHILNARDFTNPDSREEALFEAILAILNQLEGLRSLYQEED
jgi:hypothetical protein